MEHVWFVQAAISQRRAVRARLGVLENVLNASRRSLTYARLKLSALERDGVFDEGLLCAILERTWLREDGGAPRKTRALS